MKILTVVGARPQFVKAYPVSRRLRRDHEEVLVHTGQHYDEALSDVFFDELGIPEPDHHLGVGSGPHGEQTAAMIAGIEDRLADEDPDLVLCYGDTNSTLAAGIVASKTEIPLAHVEAGLRSDDRGMPEEVNRVLTDHAADCLLAPGEAAAENLRAEGITDGVFVTGDVMYDAVLLVRDRAATRSTMLADLGVAAGEYVLATVHRAHNTDDPDRLAGILDALAAVDDEVVFPAHPRTTDAMREYGLYEDAAEELTLVDPAGYVDFVALVADARAVATDSGGVQKEAFFLDTPCVTLRDTTEWTETVEAGWNVLVGSDPDRIREALTGAFDLPADRPQPYGEGDAASAVTTALESVAP
ncbi:non-hydrolyzing UDP-N-acetylglucosamine 2-epimerase [Halorussus halobius]|uniref:non-hydrolyzing UDP-N-acetylglucosamine 2-epimerase n=1 Tax=Halorussus halobius TaxID=1710537 RepID=UPI0010923AED|nr:UDP-N-acetylglucosamine 2-epimerase (non-hydrolyzing) [Halorussus halobius]